MPNDSGGLPLSGTFSLTVSNSYSKEETDLNEAYWGKPENTAYLPFNATSSEVKEALEALSGVATAKVEIAYSLLDGDRGGGIGYIVTFPGVTGATSPMGGIALTASGNGLNGTGAAVTVREVYPGSRHGGEFALSFGGIEGSALPFDADTEEVRGVIDALVVSVGGGEGGVDVWREEVEAGFRWAVAFSGINLDGDVDLIKVSSVCGGRTPDNTC